MGGLVMLRSEKKRKKGSENGHLGNEDYTTHFTTRTIKVRHPEITRDTPITIPQKHKIQGASEIRSYFEITRAPL